MFVLCFVGNGRPASAAGLIGIAGVVTDQTTGMPLEGVSVHVTPLVIGLSNVTVQTDVNGYYNADLLPGLYTVQFTPLAATGYTGQSASNLSLLGTQTINMSLTRPSYSFTGTLKDAANHLLNGVQVQLTDYFGTSYNMTTTASGTFSQTFPAGQYSVFISGDHPQYFPDGLSIAVQTPLQITSASSHTFQLPPTTQFVVHAADSGNTSISGRDIQTLFSYQGSGLGGGTDSYFPMNSGGTITTNSAGNAQTQVFSGMIAPVGSICMEMAAISYDVCNASGVTVTVGANLNLQEPQLKTISGKISDANGAGVANVSVMLNNYNYGTTTSTNALGNYSITLPVDSYTVSFYLDQGPLSVMLTPTSSAVALTTNQVRNFSLPNTNTAAITARDNTGALLTDHDLYLSLSTPSAALLQSTTDTYYATSYGTVTTNGSGVASVTLFQGMNSRGGDISTYIPAVDAVISNTQSVTLLGAVQVQFNL